MPTVQELFEYIGSADSLNGYQKSYKLVLLKVLLSSVDKDGRAPLNEIVENFHEFYKIRAKKKLPTEVQDGKSYHIESFRISKIKRIIMDNPYSVISSAGFIKLKEINNEEFLCFDEELRKGLTENNIFKVNELIDKKIDYYYKDRINKYPYLIKDGDSNMLKEYFDKVMEKYNEARTSQQFKGNLIAEILRKKIPEYIENIDFIDKEKFQVSGSPGKGNWARIPWVAIMNKEITTTTQKGVYVVYIFSEDMKYIYLTFMQGVTDIFNNLGKVKTKQKLLENAKNIRTMINFKNINIDNNMYLSDNNYGEMYKAGTIAYIRYQASMIPKDKDLITDLKRMLIYYDTYYENLISKEKNVTKNIKYISDEIINNIHNYIISKGFTYEEDLIKNFYLSLKSKPFVLLAGISGTGKSKLVELFAEALGATSENRRYKIISVRPDWSDPSDLLGYKNIEGEFQPGPLTTIIKKAVEDIDRPYFVCLDEMNLARVEYYFSDILSIMETRKKKGRIITEVLINEEVFGTDTKAKELYGNLYIPENLYIIGTVNMDETTFPFSKKVLDRANTIEFSKVNLEFHFNNSYETFEKTKIINEFLKGDFLRLIDCQEHFEIVNKVIQILIKINNILENVGLQFGYRIRDEISFYVIYALSEKLMDFNKAIDYCILQKILPRIQGSSFEIKEVLIDLFKVFVGDISKQYDPLNNEVSKKLKSYLENSDVDYPKSSLKICQMIRRFEIDGFTSYWL